MKVGEKAIVTCGTRNSVVHGAGRSGDVLCVLVPARQVPSTATTSLAARPTCPRTQRSSSPSSSSASIRSCAFEPAVCICTAHVAACAGDVAARHERRRAIRLRRDVSPPPRHQSLHVWAHRIHCAHRRRRETAKPLFGATKFKSAARLYERVRQCFAGCLAPLTLGRAGA